MPDLGASLDEFIGEDEVIEIKCPKTASKLHPLEATKKKVINFCTVDENNLIKLKKKHIITFTKSKISRDETFWEERMVKKLGRFLLYVSIVRNSRWTVSTENGNKKPNSRFLIQ
ncbi:unnamed protein product [Psylliodes chrysocephalus]|uniref:YqaJ viral recombinase domain-containing protein n=1 Tax=Psylliodes chrysocephalus TaxID=3402493 RepID=A0A9P0GCV9_9CUCU|nr:unnamed protein product [Psylliodes chrysocephala]